MWKRQKCLSFKKCNEILLCLSQLNCELPNFVVMISVVSGVLQPLPIPGSHLLENCFNSLKGDSFSFLMFKFYTQFDAQIKNKLEAGASLQGSGGWRATWGGRRWPCCSRPHACLPGSCQLPLGCITRQLLIIMKIPETWGPLTRHLKMSGLDWWGLQRVVMSWNHRFKWTKRGRSWTPGLKHLAVVLPLPPAC